MPLDGIELWGHSIDFHASGLYVLEFLVYTCSLTGSDAVSKRDEAKWFVKQDLLFLGCLEKSLRVPQNIWGVVVGKGAVGSHTLAHMCIIVRATVIISRKCGCVPSAASSNIGFLYLVPPSPQLPRTLHKPQHTHTAGSESTQWAPWRTLDRGLIYSHALQDLSLRLSKPCL